MFIWNRTTRNCFKYPFLVLNYFTIPLCFLLRHLSRHDINVRKLVFPDEISCYPWFVFLTCSIRFLKFSKCLSKVNWCALSFNFVNCFLLLSNANTFMYKLIFILLILFDSCMIFSNFGSTLSAVFHMPSSCNISTA